MSPFNNPPPKVTLEDLLRLKRHERPGPEYWERFDGELRSGMLKAFVQPEPWAWRWTRRVIMHATPWMTAGAAAGLVMAFAMHSRLSLPMAEHRLPARVAMEEMTAAPVKTAANNEATANDATAEKSLLSSTTAAGSLEGAVEDARTKYVVAVLAEPSKPTTDPKVSATTMLPGKPGDDVRYAADTLENVAMLSRGSGMAY
jgi:hypothetical protein